MKCTGKGRVLLLSEPCGLTTPICWYAPFVYIKESWAFGFIKPNPSEETNRIPAIGIYCRTVDNAQSCLALPQYVPQSARVTSFHEILGFSDCPRTGVLFVIWRLVDKPQIHQLICAYIGQNLPPLRSTATYNVIFSLDKEKLQRRRAYNAHISTQCSWKWL